MSAKIITVFNQKGGCGKTTVTMEVGGSLGLQGFKVLVVDLDPQNTSSTWHAQSEDKPFPTDIMSVDPHNPSLLSEIQAQVENYNYIVIDCPPSVENMACSEALLVSDMVLIPTIPSPTDIWAAQTAVALAKKSKETNTEMLIYMLPTMVQSNSALASSMLDYIADKVDVPMTRGSFGLRTSYRDSALFGCTVHHVANSRKAVMEVNSLVSEIIRIIKRGK